MKQFKVVIWGLAIIALGVIFGGNALGWFNIDIFFDGWWTLFIIVPGAIGLITEKEKFSNLFVVCVGVLLLLAAQNVFSYETAGKVILAIFLIMLGIWIMFRGLVRGKNDKEVEKKVRDLSDDKTMDSQIAIFSGSDKTYKDEEFLGANLVAVFGGVDFDLSNAKINKDTVIRAFAMFGGVDIKVPEDVQIKIKSRFIFGGVSDDRKDEASKGKYTIYIDATGGFGGVNIYDKGKKR